MDGKIFEGFGIEVIRRQGRYFIRYDAGELVSPPLHQMVEVEVTKEEVSKAQRSERNAYDVILKHHSQRKKVS